MRLFTSVIASAIFLVSSSAGALTTFNVTNDRSATNDISILPGQSITVNIRLSNGVGVFGLGASVSGYTESVIDFESGVAVGSINHALLFPGFFLNGLTNVLVPGGGAGPVATGPLAESFIGASGNRVLFFNGVGLASTNTNAGDYGINGTNTDAQFRLVFRASALGGSSVISIGTGYNGDGEILAGGVTDVSQNVVLNVTVVPEPGTALLMGLGLAGLAAAGRKE